MRRIERLINLIAALLESRFPMTAQEIRDEIAGYDQESHTAFRRTFERDKEALRAMGIPIEVVQTDPFGVDPEAYTIPKARYYLPELDLEADELTALRIAADAILGSGEAAEAGLMKLSIDAGAAPAGGPLIVWGADMAAEEPLLGSLYEALLDRTPVRFAYVTPGADSAAERTVEPYGLVHRRGHWYLVGRDRARADLRSFRVSRIRGKPVALEGAYDVPEGFDPGGHVGKEAWEVGAEASDTAIIRFDPSLRWWAEQNLPEATARDAPEGALDVEMPVANVDALISWVIGFGDGVEILEPPSARSRLREHIAPWLETR